MAALKTPLNDTQLELLELFSENLSDEELAEVKNLLLQFRLKRLKKAANQVWDEKGWTDEDAERMLHTHMRTPYTSFRKGKSAKKEK